MLRIALVLPAFFLFCPLTTVSFSQDLSASRIDAQYDWILCDYIAAVIVRNAGPEVVHDVSVTVPYSDAYEVLSVCDGGPLGFDVTWDPSNTPALKAIGVDEEVILNLERETFLGQLKEEKTLERIEHMLKTGKPLRN